MDLQDRVRTVAIRLHSSIQHPGQEKETHEMHLTGELIDKKGKTYLRYEEQQDGSRVSTTIKFGEEESLILRGGAVSMRLPFAINEERMGTYGSGPATFDLLVKTNGLEISKNADDTRGRFDVQYELHGEGALLGTYELTITYMEGTQ